MTIVPLTKPEEPKKASSATKGTENKGFDIIMDNFNKELKAGGELEDFISGEVAKQKIMDIKQDLDWQFEQKMDKYHEILKIKKHQEHKETNDQERKRRIEMEMEREYRSRKIREKVQVKSSLEEAGVSE